MPLLTLRVEFPNEFDRWYIKDNLANTMDDINHYGTLIWDWDLDTEKVQEPEDDDAE